MLAVLDEREADLWLDASTPAEAAVAMLRPHERPELEMFRVSPRVNRVGISDPECIAPYVAPSPDQPSLFGS
jgi:putative SOS response-associated peptidase YedK